jgi:fibronectin type 3 domain-containing protein
VDFACSNIIEAATLPPAPTGLTATPSSTSVALSWTAMSGVSSYKVYRAASSDGPFTTSVGTSTTNSWTDSGLTPDTVYYYKVSAVNIAGKGELSTSVSTHTLPVAPTTLVAAAVSANEIDLSWDAASGSTDTYTYYIYKSSDGISYGSSFASTTENTCTYNVTTGLSAGTTWYFKVTSYSDSGVESAMSSPAHALTEPTAPTGLSATASGTTINLSWSACTGAASYIIYYYDTDHYAQLGTSNTTTYADTGLDCGITRSYEVSASNATGEGEKSGVASATTALAAPTNVTWLATDVSTSGGSITLSWDAVTGASGYTVYRSTDAADASPASVGSPTTTTYTDTGLTLGTDYYYWVSTTNAAGSGSKTASVDAEIAVTSLSYGSPTDGSITAGEVKVYTYTTHALENISWTNGTANVQVAAFTGTTSSLTALFSGTTASPQSISSGQTVYLVVKGATDTDAGSYTLTRS